MKLNSGLVIQQTFADHIALLPTLLADLETCATATRTELAKRIPKNTPGIYIFYHNNEPVYVGRTRNLRRRLSEHGRKSSSHYSASFAFLRARHAAEKEGHSANLVGLSRATLSTHKVFKPLFVTEKSVVAGMTVRWVVIENAVTQALLEVYAALKFKTPFNSFETS